MWGLAFFVLSDPAWKSLSAALAAFFLCVAIGG